MVRGVYVIRFTPAEVESGSCEDFEACLGQALETLPAGARAVLLVLEGVRFLRSSGLGAMLSVCERFKPRGIRMAVCRVPPFGRNLFKISRLEEHLLIYPSVAAALDALGSGEA